MQFTSTIIVALLAVSTSTGTAAQKTSNLRGGRQLAKEKKQSGPAPASSVVFSTALEDAVITAAPSSSGVSLPSMGIAETAAPSSLYPVIGKAETAAPSSVYPAMGTAETAAPSSVYPAMGKAETTAPSLSLPAMGDAETAAPSLSLPAMGDAETAAPSSLGVSLPAMGAAETAAPSSLGVLVPVIMEDAVITAAPSSLGVSLPAMGTAETAAPLSLGVSLPAMGTAETALFPDHDRSLYEGCPGTDEPLPGSFCGNCYQDDELCCQAQLPEARPYCYHKVPAMETAETTAPSSLYASLPAMGNAETAFFSDHDRSLYAGCPGTDYPMEPSFCPMCRDDETCCEKQATNDDDGDQHAYCSKNP